MKGCVLTCGEISRERERERERETHTERESEIKMWFKSSAVGNFARANPLMGIARAFCTSA